MIRCKARLGVLAPAILLALLTAIAGSPADTAVGTARTAARASKPTVHLSRASARVGQRVRVRGTGFRHRALARVTLGGRRLGSRRTNRRGSFSLLVRVVPTSTGTHRLRVRTGRIRVTRRFKVLATANAPAAPG